MKNYLCSTSIFFVAVNFSLRAILYFWRFMDQLHDRILSVNRARNYEIDWSWCSLERFLTELFNFQRNNSIAMLKKFYPSMKLVWSLNLKREAASWSKIHEARTYHTFLMWSALHALKKTVDMKRDTWRAIHEAASWSEIQKYNMALRLSCANNKIKLR